MHMTRRLLGTGLAGVIAVAAAGVGVAKPGDPGTTVTIYRAESPNRSGGYDPGFAVVTDRRTLSLKAGDNEVKFENVAAQIDPTTVSLRDLTDAEAVVLEQSFDYDLGSVDTLLGRYVGQTIVLITEQGETRGTLLSFDANQLVIQTEDAAMPVQIVQRGKNLRDIRFGALAGGLVTKPTLSWKLKTKKGGDHLVEVTYQTRGIAWSADYTVVLSADAKKVDFSGWLTVANQSGAPFKAATLRLVSGDIHRAQATTAVAQPQYDEQGYQIDPNNPGPSKPRHEYDVPATATLGSMATKQVELFAPTSASGGRVYVSDYVPRYASYYIKQNYPQMDPGIDGGYNAKAFNEAAEYIEIKNTDKNGMGLSLPGGEIRVYKRSDDGALSLMSEELLPHTPKDGEIRIRLGASADILGERKQADFKVDERAKEMTEKFEIKVKNKKKEAVEVVLTEMPFRWRNWRIEDGSVPNVLTDDGKVQFRVKVPANGETVLTYTTVYSAWP